MFRIDSQGTVPALPAPDPDGQIAGYFSKGNPAVGQKATVVSADWANAMQEEICYVIEQAGIQLNQQGKNNHVQLKAAITTMIGVVAPAPHTHDAADIVSGTFADARIAASNVTQYQGILALDASQTVSGQFANARISGASVLQYEGSFQLDTSQIVSGTFADARIAQSNITQYNGALVHGALQGLGNDDHTQYAHLNKGGQGFAQKLQHPSTGGGDAGTTIATKDYVDAHQGVTDHGALSGLGDDDHPQYLHLNKGGQTLQQNLSVAGGVRIDNVDISSHAHSIFLGRTFLARGQQVSNTSVNIALTIGGFTASDSPGCSIMMIDMTQGGGGFDSDNRALIGGPNNLVFSGNHSPDVPTFSGGNWNFRVEQSAGNESVVCGYLYWVYSAQGNTGGPV